MSKILQIKTLTNYEVILILKIKIISMLANDYIIIRHFTLNLYVESTCFNFLTNW